MKEHPILMSTPMVQAIQYEWKTQTRRIIKSFGKYNVAVELWGDEYRGSNLEPLMIDKSGPFKGSKCSLIDNAHHCPYGTTGDLLWVKELHYRFGSWIKNGLTKTGKQKWLFKPDKKFTDVRYFDNPPFKVEKNSHRLLGWYKRSSLFMPRSLCRIILKITRIGVEQLKGITKAHAIAEGIRPEVTGDDVYENYAKVGYRWIKAKESYKSLWESINGIGSWELNPWVWVIEFRNLTQSTP